MWLGLFQASLRMARTPSEIQELFTMNIFLIPQNPVGGIIMTFHYPSSSISPGIKFLTHFTEHHLILSMGVT